MDEGYPDVPPEAIPEGWECRGRSEDALFDAGPASVIGRTLLYADVTIGTALDAAGRGNLLAASGGGEEGNGRLVGIDTIAPFGFATALSVRPPLAAGLGPAAVFPVVRTEAIRAFGDDLRSRGFEGVERDSHDRIRTDAGDRTRLTKYTGTYQFGADAPVETLRVEGWLGVWTREDAFRLAGGAYPTAGLDELLGEHGTDLSTDPSRFREALVGLIRAVR